MAASFDLDRAAGAIQPPPVRLDAMPDPESLVAELPPAPAIEPMNIFPLEWRVETPKLVDLYERARDPGWSPSTLPWDTLDVASMTEDQRCAVAYWWALLSVFDGSGPVVFARAMIHTYETKEEDPLRKCFFSVVRDEMNHEEVCGRAIVANLPSEQQARLVTKACAGMPVRGRKAARSALEQELAASLQRGFALEEEETVAGVACVALSLAFLGEPLAAVSVSVPVHRLSTRQRADMIATLLSTREARAPSA